MKVPYDFDKFLKNGENKESLFNLIKQAIKEGREDLGERVIYFSNKSECKKITVNETSLSNELASDHEEADTKLIALVLAADVTPGDAVMVRSPSGDIDILILFLAHAETERAQTLSTGAKT